MGVTLQLILGILLALSQCSYAKTSNLRNIREAPPPQPPPTQNVTEINNRDLNKIIKNNPKTENVDSKAKFVNNVNSYEELQPKLAKTEDEIHGSRRENETESSKENIKKTSTKLNREKLRESNSRAIGVDASKFWSLEYDSNINLPSTPDLENFQESPAFEGTRHPSFDTHVDLTTPPTKIFDQKFKETVESVEQNIEEIDNHEHDNDASEEEEKKDSDNIVEDLLGKSENASLEYVKTKNIVNNETVDKNFIHKDITLEQTKKLDFEDIYNDTKVYSEDTSQGEHSSTDKSTNLIATVSTTTTRKSFPLKESQNEKSNTHILSNKIETEGYEPTKGMGAATTSSIVKKDRGDLQDILNNSVGTSSEKTTTHSQTPKATTTTVETPTTSIPSQKQNISDQENNVIPLQFGLDNTPIQNSTSEHTPVSKPPKSHLTTESSITDYSIETRIAMDPSTTDSLKSESSLRPLPTESNKTNHSIESGIAMDQSTTESLKSEVTESTIVYETTTLFDLTRELSDGTTTVLPDESTTSFVVENTTEISDYTTETFTVTEETSTVEIDATTTGSGQRTSKSMDIFTATDQMEKVSERTVHNLTKNDEESTEQDDISSTTLEMDKMEPETKRNVIDKNNNMDETTTEEDMSTSTIISTETIDFSKTSDIAVTNETTPKVTELKNTTKENPIPNTTLSVPISEATSTTTESKTTSEKDPNHPTTTEYAFIPIEVTSVNHTTLLPETLSPNLNYSTTVPLNEEENKIRKVILDETSNASTEGPISSSSSKSVPTTSTASSTTIEQVNASTTVEVDSETPTEGFTKDSTGGNKGKIAAIAISSVGAICLVLLAGLLYIMKKRQKRLNYGPRCRPVSLDDYSIDNLSVYNSVSRRKGGARMSKRSFGNPAFEDPVAPTHPLNFPALAKFSTNYEDIKAEFEDIPQISARTSELPDGCETKNRYANVIPLPETRVFLNPIDGYPNSDYINANYVTGPKNTKGYYIATQGPMLNTVDDFWRMIWEQQAKVILMLTHLVENGLEKCVDYLPESETVDCSRMFGDFQIIVKKQDVKDKYIISTLQLKNMVSNSWREVTHFWYLGWPEKGVPIEANSLIAFLIEARSYMKTATIDKKDGLNGIQNGGTSNEHNPVVVHCSPGTGRTGVAIACDIAIREFETTRLVDIPKIVYRIRRDRANAVQTKEQYMFIYKVISLYATKLTGGALETF